MSSPKKRKLSLVDHGLPAGCTVTFAAGFVSDDKRYRLLEATPEILSALAAGESLHFKGDIRCNPSMVHIQIYIFPFSK